MLSVGPLKLTVRNDSVSLICSNLKNKRNKGIFANAPLLKPTHPILINLVKDTKEPE